MVRAPSKLGSLVYLLALAAILVRLAVVVTPFFDEDRLQLGYLLDEAGEAEQALHPYAFRGWWDLYRFLDGEPAATEKRMAAGALPWRTDPLQQVAYLRPVASATMAFDARLFGTAAVPAHLHSFVWFLLLAGSVLALYRRLLPDGAATVAWLAFLISPASVFALQWWSARNALLAALFAVWFLYFHLDWAESGRRDRLLLSLGSLALAVLSAEAGAAILAFALCHAVVERRPSLGRALWRLLPALSLAGGWLAIRAAAGYGVARSALYVDPLREPLTVARLALDRLDRALGVALLNQTTGSRLVIGLLVAVLVALVTIHLRSPSEQRSTLVWLGAAALLALVPAFTSRNALRPWTLLIPQLGAHAVLGLVVARAWSGRGAAPLRTARGALAAILAVACLLLPFGSQLAAAGASREMQRQRSSERLAAEFPAVTRGLLAAAERVVFLESPRRILTPAYLERWHGLEIGEGNVVSTLVVADRPVADASLRLRRLDDASIELRSDRPLVRRDDLYRFARSYPLEAGQEVRGTGFEIAVGELSGGVPLAVRVSLDGSWDDPGLVVLTWDGAVFRVVEPPPVGESIGLPRG